MNKWYIPDCYWPKEDHGKYVSHEAICFLNTGTKDAEVSICLYFEDRDPMEKIIITIPAKRTLHCRMDQLRDNEGNTIPRGVPYAAEVSSEANLTVQYSRLDTTQADLALATTIINKESEL